VCVPKNISSDINLAVASQGDVAAAEAAPAAEAEAGAGATAAAGAVAATKRDDPRMQSLVVGRGVDRVRGPGFVRDE